MPALYDEKRRAKEYSGCILLSHSVSFPSSNDRIECMGRNVERGGGQDKAKRRRKLS
jgi:hypothetical protein